MSIKSDRFREMEKIGKNVLSEMQTLAKPLPGYSCLEVSDLDDYILKYFRTRMGKKPIRAYFSWKSSKYLSHYGTATGIKDIDPETFFSTKLPLVVECIINIQYLHNHILDEKYNTWSDNHPQVWSNLISSNLLRELLFTYLGDHVNPYLTPELAQRLHRQVGKLLLTVDLGQRLDKHKSDYACWVEGCHTVKREKWLEDEWCRALISPIIEDIKTDLKKGHDFLDLYFHRIYLSNCYFFRAIAEIVGLFFPKIPGLRRQELSNYSLAYGFMLQTVNDYSDFAYPTKSHEQHLSETAGKKTTDVFSDLYNFNITLPLVFHLQRKHNRKVEEYLSGGIRKKSLIDDYPLQVREEMEQSGSIYKCVEVSRAFAKVANRQLYKDNPVSAYLFDMTDMARDNKFLRIFN